MLILQIILVCLITLFWITDLFVSIIGEAIMRGFDRIPGQHTLENVW